MKFQLAAAALALALVSPFSAGADSPVNGLGGIAVSPDGATVLAAGDSRAIYVLDSATMAVKDRIYSATTIVWMRYRQDGKVVFMRDTSGKVHALDSATFKSLWSIDRTETAAYASLANQLAVTVRDGREYVALLIDGATFETMGTYKLGEKFYPTAQGISTEGLRMVVLSRSEKRPGEEKDRPPNDLKGVVREIYAQEHDQRGARIAQIDLLTGQVNVTESWFRSDSARALVVSVVETYVLGYSSDNARIDAAGEVEIIDTGVRSRNGAAMTPSMDTIFSGRRSEIVVKKLTSDAARVFKVDGLPGWPEYVVRFTNGPDGKIYAGTTAYRVIVLDLEAGTIKAHAVY